MMTSFFDTNDEYKAALAHASGLFTTASLTYHRASIAPTRDRAPAEPVTVRAIIEDYAPDFEHQAHNELIRCTAKRILSEHLGDSIWFIPESMKLVLNAGVVPPPPEHPIVSNVFDHIAGQPQYFAARLPLTIPHHPTSFALAYALIKLTAATPTYQPSSYGAATLSSVSIEHHPDEQPPLKTSFDPWKTNHSQLPKHASRITIGIESNSHTQQLASPIYVGAGLNITTTEQYFADNFFGDPIQALATFIGDFTPKTPSQHVFNYAFVTGRCLPAETAAANILAYIDRHITQPALSYAAGK